MKFSDMEPNENELSGTLKKNVVIDNEIPFRVVSKENLHQYQEQVNFELILTDVKSFVIIRTQHYTFRRT